MYGRVLGLALALVLLGSVAVVAEWLKRAICFSVYVSGESRKICALVNELEEKPMFNATLSMWIRVLSET